MTAGGKGELPKGSAPVEPAAELSKSDVEGAAAGPGEEKALFEEVGKGETVEEGKEGWEEDCGMKEELEEGDGEEWKAKLDSSDGERRP